MKVVSLRAENFKRLTAVDITPDPADPLVVLSGNNANGKTSVLDAIWLALQHRAGSKGNEQPIRKGERKARVRLDLGEVTVERTWTKSGTNLTVTAAGGGKLDRPQDVLDALVGKLSFDPMAFIGSSAREQLATLLALVQLPFDPAQLDAERKAAYEQRTIVNREVKRLSAIADDLPPVPASTPTEEVSATSLIAAIGEARDLAAKRTALIGEHLRVSTQLRELEAMLQGIVEQGKALPPTPDTADQEAQLAGLDATNAAVRAGKRRAEVLAQLGEVEAEAEGFTEIVERLDAEKTEGLAKAKMPVPGLGFDEDGVLYNGVPLSQASGAEKIRIAVGIAQAGNPDVKVVRITDASLIDTAGMEVLREMAGNDWQLWVERVADPAEGIGFVIEDGAVAKAPTTKAAGQ